MIVLRYVIPVLLLFGFMPRHAFAQYLEFVENKGQWHEQVKFKTAYGNTDLYLLQDGYKMVLHSAEDLQQLAHPHKHTESPAQVKVRSHAYKVSFIDANPLVQVTGEKVQQHYNNYFIGDDPSSWSSHCKVYSAVVYKDIYKGIDVRYYTGTGNMKYDIIVHPGADLQKLALRYEGVDGMNLKKEQLVLSTSVTTVTEQKPYAYQVLQEGRKEVRCVYKLKGNIISFEAINYDSTKSLVIDPEWIFSTFTGSTADNWGFTATYDKHGNFYAGGIVFNFGFPVNAGAYATFFSGGVNDGNGGGYDIGIMKFNPIGTSRVYATYIGGSHNEQPHSLIADSSGNLFIAGRSASLDYPTTLPHVGPGGLYDIVISKLSADGSSMMASRRIGGSGDDCVNISRDANPVFSNTIRRNYGDDARSEIILDKKGNVCMVASTQSPNFPLVNAFQATNGGGTMMQDAVILRLTGNLSTVLLSTYLGGSGDDAAFVVSQNPTDGFLYVGGATTSANLPGNKTGTIGPNYSGGQCDGFVTVIDTLNQLHRLSYVGTTAADIVFGLKFDQKGFPYITGTTTGAWQVVNATYSNAGSKQFISKLKPDLSGFVYSTVFGSASPVPNISPVAFLVDRCENVYVSGWGGNVNDIPGQETRNMPITPDAIKKENQTDGSDFYFFVLERNASGILYGSYFGQTGGTGEHVDGGTSRFDEEGVIYQAICANCAPIKPPFPIHPPGAVAFPNNPSPNCNLAAVKIAFNLAGVKTSLKAALQSNVKSSHCLPMQMEFKDTLAQGQQYIWSFGDGTKKDTTSSPITSHWFTTPGTFTVTLISIDSSKCNIADTATGSVIVRNDSTTADFDVALESCATRKVLLTNKSLAPAWKPFSSNSFEWDFGDGIKQVTGPQPQTHVYSQPGTYTIYLRMIDTNYCNIAIDSTVIFIPDSIKASLVSEGQMECLPSTISFRDTIGQGKQYIWNFGDAMPNGLTDTPGIQHVYTAAGTFYVKLIAVDSASCNVRDTADMFLGIKNDSAIIKPKFISQNCTTRTVIFQNHSTFPPSKPFNSRSFVWSWGDGKTDTTSAIQVTHTYAIADTFQVKLILIDTIYCNRGDSITNIIIPSNIKADFDADTLVCSPYRAVLTALSPANAQSYTWYFGDGNAAVGKDTSYIYQNPGTYNVSLLVKDSNSCNKQHSFSQVIKVSPNPVSSFSITPSPPKVNTPVKFINQSSGAIFYKWHLGEGDTLYTTRKDTLIQKLYTRTDDYTACLVAINSTGCADTTCRTFRALFVRKFDVPSAFSPNDDGVNDRIHVQGAGFRSMEWKIYNRWGKIVFETKNQEQGWDGRHNGQMQPMEVYTYTLNVEFLDGHKDSKTGDITLVR